MFTVQVPNLLLIARYWCVPLLVLSSKVVHKDHVENEVVTTLALPIVKQGLDVTMPIPIKASYFHLNYALPRYSLRPEAASTALCLPLLVVSLREKV